MKKTKYFIAVRDNNEVKAELVSGYYVYVKGLAIGIHKKSAGHWTASDMSTGVGIVNGNTRQEAYENILPMIDRVKDLLKLEIYNEPRDIINQAYANI